MERKEFFEMAQKVAMYTNCCKDLLKPLLSDCIVKYGGIGYYPQSLQVGYDKHGNVENIALLHDLKANSITYARLERVEKV